MKCRFRISFAAIASASALLALGAAAAAAPAAAPAQAAAAAKSCPSGYVDAQLSWGEKCLRTGEFCKIGNPEYHAYGFDCPASGHLASYSAASRSSGTSSSGAACGVERWMVKTLQDRPRLLGNRRTTIRFLVSRPAPHPLPTRRLPFERHIYTLVAAVTLVRHETDSDLHLVLQEGGYHMIAEAPSFSCESKATAYRRKQMKIARNHVQLCSKARVTGVAFFDFNHGQTGVAPNAIELHPILSFTCLKR